MWGDTAAMSERVLVLVGRGRYGDTWHDHAAQADEVVRLLRADGHDVRVRSTFPTTLADLGDWVPALLVVTAGRAEDVTDADGEWRAFHDARHALVACGTAVLGLHQAANTFADDPRWAATLGGRWVEGRSWHPPHATATFRVVDDEHPVTGGLRAVTADDERYADLEVAPDSRVLVVADVSPDEADEHGTPGAHPVVWQAPGPARVLYDALGHDVRSFASQDRRALLTAELAWLLP
jgi:uncharacterized protein